MHFLSIPLPGAPAAPVARPQGQAGSPANAAANAAANASTGAGGAGGAAGDANAFARFLSDATGPERSVPGRPAGGGGAEGKGSGSPAHHLDPETPAAETLPEDGANAPVPGVRTAGEAAFENVADAFLRGFGLSPATSARALFAGDGAPDGAARFFGPGASLRPGPVPGGPGAIDPAGNVPGRPGDSGPIARRAGDRPVAVRVALPAGSAPGVTASPEFANGAPATPEPGGGAPQIGGDPDGVVSKVPNATASDPRQAGNATRFVGARGAGEAGPTAPAFPADPVRGVTPGEAPDAPVSSGGRTPLSFFTGSRGRPSVGLAPEFASQDGSAGAGARVPSDGTVQSPDSATRFGTGPAGAARPVAPDGTALASPAGPRALPTAPTPMGAFESPGPTLPEAGVQAREGGEGPDGARPAAERSAGPRTPATFFETNGGGGSAARQAPPAHADVAGVARNAAAERIAARAAAGGIVTTPVESFAPGAAAETSPTGRSVPFGEIGPDAGGRGSGPNGSDSAAFRGGSAGTRSSEIRGDGSVEPDADSVRAARSGGSGETRAAAPTPVTHVATTTGTTGAPLHGSAAASQVATAAAAGTAGAAGGHAPTPAAFESIAPVARAVLEAEANANPAFRVAVRHGELGAIEIHLRRGMEGLVVDLISDNPEAARLLGSASQSLAQHLRGAGVDLDSIHVGHGDAGSNQPGAEGGEARRGGAGRRAGAEPEASASPWEASPSNVHGDNAGGSSLNLLA